MKKKLGLQDFADYIAQHEGVDRKTADAFVRSFFDVIEQGLSNDKLVKIKGFGTFKLVAVSERESVNINTGERFQISGHTKVSFTPDANMKELVNQPFAHFEAVDLNDDTDTKEFELIDDEMEEEEEYAESDTDTDEDEQNDDLKVDTIENITIANDEVPATESANNDTIIELANEASNATSANTEPRVTSPSSVTTNDATTNHTAASNNASASTTHQPQSLSQTTPVMSIDTNEDDDDAAPTPASTHQQESPSVSSSTTMVGSEATHPSHHSSDNGSDDVKVNNEEEIVVTAPTPINKQTAEAPKSDTTENVATPPTNNASNTMGYTYNEVPSPRKRNWWKIISLTMLVLLLMTGSYFVGYYRMLCPHCNDDELFPSEQAQPTAPVAKPQPVPQKDAAQTNIADTLKANQQPNNVVNGNTAPPPNATSTIKANAEASATTKGNNASQADATHKASAPKRPATHKVDKGENVYRIARKYYGSDSYAEKIIKANNLKNANNIVVGMELKLP